MRSENRTTEPISEDWEYLGTWNLSGTVDFDVFMERHPDTCTLHCWPRKPTLGLVDIEGLESDTTHDEARKIVEMLRPGILQDECVACGHNVSIVRKDSVQK